MPLSGARGSYTDQQDETGTGFSASHYEEFKSLNIQEKGSDTIHFLSLQHSFRTLH